MFKVYEVGKRYPDVIGHDEGIIFDITDSGALLPVYFNNPRNDEVSEMKSDKPIQIGYLAKNNVIIMLMKFGRLDWMDAPYNPHLSIGLTHLPDLAEGMGLSVNLLLFDTSSGELKTQRLFAMNDKLTNNLVKEIEKLMAKPFNQHGYEMDIQSAYRFTSNQLAKQARMVYRIH